MEPKEVADKTNEREKKNTTTDVKRSSRAETFDALGPNVQRKSTGGYGGHTRQTNDKTVGGNQVGWLPVPTK